MNYDMLSEDGTPYSWDGSSWTKLARLSTLPRPEVNTQFAAVARLQYLTDQKKEYMDHLVLLRDGLELDDTADGAHLLMSTYEDTVRKIEVINKSLLHVSKPDDNKKQEWDSRVNKARAVLLFEYLQEKPNARVRCPFHNGSEMNDSFALYRDGRGFCFTCNVGADAIAYVQKVEGLSFADAVRRLSC